eukprot:CAMPEP_0178922006 /NCGR_PEP_ID=MMETSP0786-20121207/15894_1 /TAXON_ID=186022 /ORGANISM="Thalassionema frauenfeldii, Strain CCMP 1798" /LENGTH=532 /DNA_ID=CAMNT_0020596283 /DNA_START=173 /DNA_END=1771 /DNA_ORIENTATION=-
MAATLEDGTLHPSFGMPETLDPETGLPAETQHESLIGEVLSPKQADRAPTLTTLGDTPFEHVPEDDNVEHHKIVATEIIADPVAPHAPEPILQNSIILLQPRIAECKTLIECAKQRGLFVTCVNTTHYDGTNVNFYPTAEALLEIGVHQVYEPPVGQKFSVVECANHLKTIESQQNLRFLGVIPLREMAVDYSDILAAMLGLTVHNDLGLASNRRDKALMKSAVAAAGLRVAKYARLTHPKGEDVRAAIEELELDFPVVVKTPRGMATQDVYICHTLEEATERSSQIVRSIGPDGTKANFSLLEEFLAGQEFAVNVIASPTTYKGVQVTDIWEYSKKFEDGSMVNTWQSLVDCHSPKYSALVRYAEGICRAVGVKYGFAHVELMSTYSDEKERFIDPVMVEVGARLAGGRKAIMAEKVVPGWYPFEALLDASCGFPVRVPPSFTPLKAARHVYIPNNSKKSGILKSYKGDDFERLPTYDSHEVIKHVGKPIEKSISIMSFPAFVWLIGDEEQVAKDSVAARNEFIVEVEEAE